MENQFLDYASWRKSNDKLLTYLINNKSLIIARFKYVIAVVDYLFDKVINEKYELDCPDIWPAVIQSRALFAPPKNRYVLGPGLFTPDDLFIYNPKTLKNEDLTYINALMLSYSKEIIGLNDATKIVDSIYYYVWQKSNFDSVKERGESDITIANRFIENVSILHKSFFNTLRILSN